MRHSLRPKPESYRLKVVVGLLAGFLALVGLALIALHVVRGCGR